MLPGDGMQVKPSSHQAIGDRMDGAAAMSARGERTLLPEGKNEYKQRVSKDYVPYVSCSSHVLVRIIMYYVLNN